MNKPRQRYAAPSNAASLATSAVYLTPVKVAGKTIYIGRTADGKLVSLMHTPSTDRQKKAAAKGSSFKLVFLTPRKG